MSEAGRHPASDKPHHGGFWTSLPGILTGLAALLTAVVGLMSLLRDSDGDRRDPQAATAPAVSETAAARSTEASSPSSVNTPGVFAEGRITMRSPDNVDLETGVVGTPPGEDLYLYCGGTDCLLNAMSSLLVVAEAADGKDSCIAALKMRHDQALALNDLRQGQTLCIQTSEGHLGRLRLEGLPGPGSIDFVFSYTLWL